MFWLLRWGKFLAASSDPIQSPSRTRLGVSSLTTSSSKSLSSLALMVGFDSAARSAATCRCPSASDISRVDSVLIQTWYCCRTRLPDTHTRPWSHRSAMCPSLAADPPCGHRSISLAYFSWQTGMCISQLLGMLMALPDHESLTVWSGM